MTNGKHVYEKATILKSLNWEQYIVIVYSILNFLTKPYHKFQSQKSQRKQDKTKRMCLQNNNIQK